MGVIPTGQAVAYMCLVSANRPSALADARIDFASLYDAYRTLRTSSVVRAMLQAVTIGMLEVLARGVPLQIRNMVITLISIFVVNRSLTLWVRDKCLGYNSMNSFCVLTAIVEYRNRGVTSTIIRRD